MSTITGTIRSIKRLQNSNMGNPNYAITLESGITYRTAPNTSWAYEVTGHMVGKGFTFTLSNAGRIESAICWSK